MKFSKFALKVMEGLNNLNPAVLKRCRVTAGDGPALMELKRHWAKKLVLKPAQLP